MITNRSQTEDSDRRVSGRRTHRLRVGLVLACLAIIGLIQTGCQSPGCSTCGLGSRLSNGVQNLNARLFSGRNHGGGGGCSTCGTLGAVEEGGVIVEGGVPIAAPGAIAVPAPATILPSPPAEGAPQLDPIPSTPTSATGAASRAATSPMKSAYEASANRSTAVASRRGSDLSRAYHLPAESKPTTLTLEEPDIFDNLPPVDLPSEFARKPVAVDPTPSDTPADVPPVVVPKPQSSTQTSSVEPGSAGDRLVLPTTPVAVTTTRAAPGIDRSASVAPQLVGGSLPSVDGLAWLREKGYKTLVDLRPRGEIDASFPDLVTDAGMLYVPIPVVLDQLSPTRLARFNDLIGQNDQRPLYFCDADGRRAGLIWYLRLRSKEHEDPASARSKAEEIGLQPADLAAAEKFLKLHFAADLAPAIAPIAVSPLPPEPVLSVSRTSAGAATAQSDGSSTREWTDLARSTPTTPFDPFSRPGSWKPAAALVLSGLGAPLAYWSGSFLRQKRAPRRASLVAKGPGPRKSLPSSDA